MMPEPEKPLEPGKMSEFEMPDGFDDLRVWIAANARFVPVSIRLLAGDGSTRRIFRVAGPGGETAVAVASPLAPGRTHPDENEGYLAVARHLRGKSVPVPEVYATNLERGYFLLEDLGDERLYETVIRLGWDDAREALAAHYSEAIDLLARMQAPGGEPFDPSVTPNEPYSVEFVSEREARYFHDELVAGWAGMKDSWPEIQQDCVRLAVDAVEGVPQVFMHRDYQSRNLMFRGGSLVVIDFQGARLGPGLYDLVALLLDPYAGVPEAVRSEMIELYRRATGWPTADEAQWSKRWSANGANRMMQALGAFAKLGGRMGRPGFLEHIPAGLNRLSEMLRAHGGAPRLAALADALRERAGGSSAKP